MQCRGLSAKAVVNALPALIRARAETLLFRVYLTDALRAQGEGKYLTERWYDLLRPAPKDERTPEEIVADIIQNAGLTLT